MKFKKIFILSLLLLICFPYFSYASDSIYVWENNLENVIATSNLVENKNSNFLNLTCGSAILMEQNTGKILYEHNSHDKLRPASVTKVMSILLIMEAIDNGTISLEDKVPCSKKASSMGGSQIWLDETENLTVNELLKAICVVSRKRCLCCYGRIYIWK